MMYVGLHVFGIDCSKSTYLDAFIAVFPLAPDGPPQNIQFELRGLDSVVFSWTPPLEELQNGVITGYRISCVADSNRTRDPITENAEELPRMATVLGLTPATRYNCSLAARTSAGFGANDTRVVLTSKYNTLCVYVG